MALKPETIERRLIAADGRPSGFDYMRLSLATLVVCSHSTNVSYGQAYTYEVWSSWARPFLAIILPMFFALSGFLVAGSLERCRTLISFLGLRIIRIVPALTVETILAAILIGPLFTSLPLREYIADDRFRSYFLNIVGDIHYLLPGVFSDNPWKDIVNNQLWTVPYELYCYAILGTVTFVGILYKKSRLIWFIIAFHLFLVARQMFRNGLHPTGGGTVAGHLLILCFLYGVGFYLFRRQLLLDGRLFFGALLLSLLTLSVPAGDYFSPIFIVYVTIYLGLRNPKRRRIFLSGDYSYAIFLYGFSIQQAFVAIMGPSGQRWYINILVALPTTVLLALFSWWCVEKPAWRLRKPLVRFENYICSLTPSNQTSRLLLQPLLREPVVKESPAGNAPRTGKQR